MSGTMARNKGKRGERGVIDLLQPVVNEVYELNDMEAPILKRNTLQSDDGGSDIAGLPWLALEVKYQEQENVNGWWRQTLEQAGQDGIPVLVYRRNNAKWRVRMFGMLGTPGCGYTVPVTVDIEHFLLWFRLRLIQELTK